MRTAGCVLVLGAIVGAACQRSAFEPADAGAQADFAASAAPDLAPPIALDLASWIGPDLQPPPEAIAICPRDSQADTGTNSVVRVHASTLIDQQSITPTSLAVQLGATPIAGSLSVTGQDLVFEPTAPWPANAMLHVSLAAGVRDTLGRPLAPAGKTWSFSTGAGAQPTDGFKFTPPICPYLGDHAIDYAVTRDGSQTIIAWSTSGDVVATSLTADATDFVKPRIVSHDDIGFDDISVTAVDGVATFAYVMTFNSDLVYWSRAQDDWMMPATEQLLTTDLAVSPSVAAASGGPLAIAWETLDADGFESGASVITSSNGGTSFSMPKPLPTSSYCPRVLYQNGRLVLAWLDSGTGTGAIKVMTSSDNGASFGAPVIVEASGTCPQLVDGGNGDVLLLYAQGDPSNQQALMLGRYTPSSGAVGTPSQLYAPDSSSQCSYLAASPSGKLVLAHSRGPNGGTNWTTELRTSDDYGKTFGAATTPDVIDALGACPSLTITDDDQLTMAWHRDSYQLQVSRGHPRRPCE